MAVGDTGMTPLNKIIDRCFKEIGLKQRDYNGRTHFGSYKHHINIIVSKQYLFLSKIVSDRPR